MEYEIQAFSPSEIPNSFLQDFDRLQQVTHCWRNRHGRWRLEEIAFTEQWNLEELAGLSTALRENASRGGCVLAAINSKTGTILGFASVLPEFFGGERRYLQLAELHVSAGERGRGIGRSLLLRAAGWAKESGAGSLYISAHSSAESQAFYRAIGCIDARHPEPDLVEKEPCDVQMEYPLGQTITRMQPADLDPVMEIWLQANQDAHPFVPQGYWEEQFSAVRDSIARAEIFLCRENEDIQGFAGVTGGDFLAGLFVRAQARSRGIGGRLITYCQWRYPQLKLAVYQKNQRALHFYLMHGFQLLRSQADPDTCERELLLSWERESAPIPAYPAPLDDA